jgi:polygalacturonase
MIPSRSILFIGAMLAASLSRSPAGGADSVTPPQDTTAVSVALPDIPANLVTLRAVGDGKTDDTAAFLRALAALDAKGGGRLEVPAGRFLIHPVTLISRLDLHLDSGATLLMDDNPADYIQPGVRNRQCISAVNCHDIAITGSGTIDGQGASWWPRYVKSYVPPPGTPPPMHRPYMVTFTGCMRVLVEGVTLTNSPSFHLVPAQCRDVTVRNVKILAPEKAPNTDGMDPSGWNFHIVGCAFDVGDDCIALKPAGRIEPDRPSCRNFLIEQCTFRHGHGMSIGGQTPGGLDGMVVRDCTFDGTQAGIRMKAPRGNGGLVENVTYDRLTMKNVKVPILITSYYPRIPADPAQDPSQAVDSLTPIWRHIRISNVTSTDSPSAGRIIGLPEMPVSDIVLTNVVIDADKGLQVVNARDIRFVNSRITPKTGPSLLPQSADVTGLEAHNGS